MDDGNTGTGVDEGSGLVVVCYAWECPHTGWCGLNLASGGRDSSRWDSSTLRRAWTLVVVVVCEANSTCGASGESSTGSETRAVV